ncbi:MAG TPA: MTH1187 family thiamine-binding protein [Nitrospiria bacterium]|nr:MTH1187 family thiamine-binding protein [Nitrospiria bacterium]
MPKNRNDEIILLEFSMSPLTKGESVGEYVSRSLEIIDNSGLDYKLNPMGTVIEGPWDEVLGVVRTCWERMKQDCDRISTVIKIDYRKGATGRLAGKIESIQKRLGGKIKS